MKRIPSDLKYTETHLWFQATGEDEGIIGLTDYAQARLGDLIAVELPRVGMRFAAHDVIANLEGMLQSSELEAFANLEILETNPRLEVHPSTVNRVPYQEGWILKVKLHGVARWLDAPSYAEYIQKGVITEGA